MAFVTVKVEPGTPPPWIEDGMEQTRKNRFKLMNDVEFDDFINSIDGKKTKEVERFAMGVFQSYMEEAHLKEINEADNANADDDDESRKNLDATLLLADDSKLDEIVAQFYPSARTKRGEYYSKNTIILIRFSLSRYLKKLKNVDITDPSKFPKACMSFRAAVKMLKKEGKISKPHKPVSDEDMQKIQASLDLDDNVGLQRKVFIDIMLYFCIRGGGRDRLRSMKPGDLVFKKSDDGYEYIEVFDSYIKNNEASSQGEIYEIPGHPRCPVKALKKYLSKLDPMRDVLFQRPKSKFSKDMTTWYDNAGLGRNYLSTLMKLISEDTGCRTIYTNHCLCITKISNLPSLGYSTRGMPVNNDVDDTYNCTSNYSRSPPSAKKNNLDYNNLENDIQICNQQQQAYHQRELDMDDDSDSDEEGVSVVEHGEDEYTQKQQREQQQQQLQQEQHHQLQQQRMRHQQQQQNQLQHQQQQLQQQQLQQYQQRQLQQHQQQQQYHQQQQQQHQVQQQQQNQLQQQQIQHQQHQLNTLQEERQQIQQQNGQQQNYKDTLLIPPTSSPSQHPSEVAANKRKLESSNHLNDLENSGKKFKQPEEKDDLDHFFCSMAETMRQLSNRTRAELKFKIHHLVHQAELDSTFP